MVSASTFDTDDQGKIITRPLTGYTIVPVANAAILARVEYAETPEQIHSGGKALQLVLTPQIALELAGVLTKQALRILSQQTPDQKN